MALLKGHRNYIARPSLRIGKIAHVGATRIKMADKMVNFARFASSVLVGAEHVLSRPRSSANYCH